MTSREWPLNRGHFFDARSEAKKAIVEAQNLPPGLKHDPEKHALGLDPRVGTGFPKRSCSNKKIERDDDSKKSHPALVRTEALKKADQLCNAADIYRYVFSTELKPPQ
jgi:hypothetical protein